MKSSKTKQDWEVSQLNVALATGFCTLVSHFALSFKINYTVIDQSQSSITSMYILRKLILHSD